VMSRFINCNFIINYKKMNLVKAVALMVLGTRATLTTGGTVTGSSFENNS